ncbi:MAG: hypothetical protein ACE10K_13615, partial [Rhodothermales bacterium]
RQASRRPVIQEHTRGRHFYRKADCLALSSSQGRHQNTSSHWLLEATHLNPRWPFRQGWFYFTTYCRCD